MAMTSVFTAEAICKGGLSLVTKKRRRLMSAAIRRRPLLQIDRQKTIFLVIACRKSSLGDMG